VIFFYRYILKKENITDTKERKSDLKTYARKNIKYMRQPSFGPASIIAD